MWERIHARAHAIYKMRDEISETLNSKICVTRDAAKVDSMREKNGRNTQCMTLEAENDFFEYTTRLY